jgi:DNA-binding NarL/FixJ family response regulator
VYLVDDEALVLEGIRLLLDLHPDFDVVGTAEGAEEALAGVAATTPDLLVTDLQMEGLDGIALTRLAKMEWPDLPVLVLSSADESLHAADALAADASGYLMKRLAPDHLPDALHAIHAGHIQLSDSMRARLRPAGVAVEADDSEEEALLDALREVPRPLHAVARRLDSPLPHISNRLHALLSRHGMTDIVQLRLLLRN